MDLTRYLDAYEQSARAVADLAAGRTAEEWSRDTACPGWAVADQVAHVSALEHQFVGDPLPPALATYGRHVRNDYGKHIENGVVAYRRESPADAAAELHAVLDRRFAQLRATPLDPAAETDGLLGAPVPWARFLPVRFYDVWAHEQDIRRALGRPVSFDGLSGEVAVETVLAVLPMAVAKGAKAPPGSSVSFDVSGSPAAAVTVVVDDAGRGRLEQGLRPGATCTVRCDAPTLALLQCGRIDPATAEVAVEGDTALGDRVVGSLTVTF